MKALKEKDLLILSYLDSQEPNGAFLNEAATRLSTVEKKCSAQNAYRYLKKLIKKELARHGTDGLYHIADKGKAALNDIHVPYMQAQPKPFNPAHPSSPGHSPTLPATTTHTQPIQGQATNLHAFEVHYQIYPTSYAHTEASLATAQIPFKPSGNRKHPSYIIMFNGLRMRIGSRQLIAWGPQLTEPITVKADKIEGKALKLNIDAVMALLHKTGIRVQETLGRQIKANVYYRELAIVNNAAVEKLQKGKGYIPIAFDRQTGRASIWLDPTPTPAAETNKKKNHEVLRRWGQGIEDGEIKPYEDEMQTRKDIEGLTGLVAKQLEHNAQVGDTLDTLLANQQSQLRWFEHHDRLTIELTRLIKQLREQGAQRRL